MRTPRGRFAIFIAVWERQSCSSPRAARWTRWLTCRNSGFALGEPEVETTTIDNAATALEASAFFIRKVGTDGFRIHHQATLKKVVSDRLASLDEETEIKPAIRKLVEGEFARGATVPVVPFPEDGTAVQDSPRLTLVVVDPEAEWKDGGQAAERIGQWTKERGKSPRLYPGSLVWCARKPGRELRDRVELWLAWQRVTREVAEGVLGAEFDRTDRAEVQAKVKDAEEAAKDEVWGGYRFVALADTKAVNGLKIIDLGAGHASANETLCGRIIGALKAEAPAQRIRRRRLHRPSLAAGVQGNRRLAAHEPTSELPKRLTDPVERSGFDPSPQDRRVRGKWRFRPRIRRQG